jgi:hypothetical protein
MRLQPICRESAKLVSNVGESVISVFIETKVSCRYPVGDSLRVLPLDYSVHLARSDKRRSFYPCKIPSRSYRRYARERPYRRNFANTASSLRAREREERRSRGSRAPNWTRPPDAGFERCAPHHVVAAERRSSDADAIHVDARIARDRIQTKRQGLFIGRVHARTPVKAHRNLPPGR